MDVSTLVFTAYFDGRDGAGEKDSEIRNSDRNYLVQRDGNFTTYGNVMRDSVSHKWYGVNNHRRVTGYRSTRGQAAADLVALNPYGVVAY